MKEKNPLNDPIIYKRSRDNQGDIVISVLVYVLFSLIFGGLFFVLKYGHDL